MVFQMLGVAATLSFRQKHGGRGCFALSSSRPPMPEREVDITEGHQDVGKKAMYLQHVKLDSVSGLGFQC